MASIPDQPVSRFAIVLLVFVVFFWLRWDSWPNTYFADELIPLAVVQHMVQSGTLDTNWDNADWRGNYAAGVYDLRQYNFSSYHVTLRALTALATPWQDALPTIVFYRYCSVFFQALALLLVMDLIRRMLNWPLAGLAGLFIAVMPQSVIDAHYARPETFVTLLVAANVWLGWFSCQVKKSLWAEALAALLWGVAFACKISLLPMAVLACGFLLWRKQSLPVLAAWWLVFLAGFAVSAPYALMDPQGFAGGAGILFKQYGPDMNVSDGQIFGSAGVLVEYLWVFFGWPVWLLLSVAVLLLVVLPKERYSLYWLVVVSAGATLVYGILFAYQKVFFERNLSHLIPVWSVLFACGVAGLWQWLVPDVTRPKRRLLCLGVFVFLLSGFMVERAGLSAEIVRTFFGGSTVIADKLVDFEKNLLVRQQRSRIVRMNPMRDYAHIGEFPSDVFLQVPRYKVPDQLRLDALLQDAGWVSVARLDLPLGYLPYNQLQINHAPVAYDYYIRPEADKVTQ